MPIDIPPSPPTPPPPIIPVIVGPTAGGKTAIAIALVQELAARGKQAQIITADAYQIYRGLDLGTAKPTPEEQAAAVHHLIDIVEPTEAFTVHDWLGRANGLTADLLGRGITPIMVGGTNLYVKAYLEGLFEGPEPDERIKAEVSAMSQPERRARLGKADPEAIERIHAADERRTRRALEVLLQTGTPISALQQQWDREKSLRAGVRVLGLEWEAEAINRRINARVKAMIGAGLVDEARSLWEAGLLGPQACEAIGYKQLIPYFEGKCSEAESIERIKIDSRRFAKNQRTWLKRFRIVPNSMWIEPANQETRHIAQSVTNTWLTG